MGRYLSNDLQIENFTNCCSSYQNPPVINPLKLSRLTTLIVILFSLVASISPALSSEFERREGTSQQAYPFDTLTGDWGGTRSALLEQGVKIEIEYFGDVFGNLSGGNDKIATLSGLTMFEVYFDTEKILGWTDSRFFFSTVAPHGGKPTRNLGSIHAVSNLEANSSFRVFEAWGEKTFFNQKLSIRAGLYSIDQEFDIQETSDIFISDGFGTGLELGNSGLNGPPAYPTTSLGIRVKAQALNSFYLQTAILDGVPGDPSSPEGTKIKLRGDDGLFIINEVGQLLQNSDDQLERKIGLGGWLYTAEFDDLNRVDGNGNPLKQTGTFGVYGFIEGMLYPEAKNSGQGLFGFLRVGYADGNTNQTELYYHGGLTYRGLFPDRNEDILGFGVSVSSNGKKFIASKVSTGEKVKGKEILLEMLYSYQAFPWLNIKPSLQYIFNPGTNPDKDNVFLAGTHFFIKF